MQGSGRSQGGLGCRELPVCAVCLAVCAEHTGITAAHPLERSKGRTEAITFDKHQLWRLAGRKVLISFV